MAPYKKPSKDAKRGQLEMSTRFGVFHGPLKKWHCANVGFLYSKIVSLVIREHRLHFLLGFYNTLRKKMKVTDG